MASCKATLHFCFANCGITVDGLRRGYRVSHCSNGSGSGSRADAPTLTLTLTLTPCHPC
jgi:hypothetical protein